MAVNWKWVHCSISPLIPSEFSFLVSCGATFEIKEEKENLCVFGHFSKAYPQAGRKQVMSEGEG